jgi:cell division protein FtsW (lipid II flippase)
VFAQGFDLSAAVRGRVVLKPRQIELVACGFAILIAFKRQYRIASFCLIGLILTYGLISNFLLLIGTNFGERLMYLPSAFFVMLIAIGVVRFRMLRVAIAIVIVLFSIRTITYAQRWNDRRSFYEYSIAHQPDSIRLRMLLIAERLARERLERLRGYPDDVLKAAESLWREAAQAVADYRAKHP